MLADSGVFRRGSGSIVHFFLLTFAFTWALQWPAVIAGERYLPLAMLGIFGPMAAAIVVTARGGGRPAVRQLFAGLGSWRVPLRYYVVGLILPGLLLTGVLLLLRQAGRTGPIAYLPDVGKLVVAFVVAIAEEVGWRGFALRRLQQKMSPFAASGVIGVLWTLWHIPMFVGVGVQLEWLLVMGLFFIGGSLVFTWVFNGTRGSLLLVVLAHVGAHLDNSHAALPADGLPLVVHAMVYAGLGLLLVRPQAVRRAALRPDTLPA